MNQFSNLGLIFFALLPILWLLTLVVLAIWTSKKREFRWIPCVLLAAPFTLLPILGMFADANSRISSASNWGPSGIVAAPLAFFLAPFIAYHEYSERTHRNSLAEAYQAIEVDPTIIWSQKLYTFGAEWPPEKQAAHKYIKNNFEDLTEDQLMVLVKEGWRDKYIRSSKLSAAFLREIFGKYKTDLNSSRLPSIFFMNPNCPPDILEEVFYNPDHYGDSRVRAVLRNLNCPVHILSEVGNNREKYGDLLFSFALQHINCPPEILERVINNPHEYKSHMPLDARKTLESQTSEDF
ncbi:MAG: hypothetical protein AAGH72_00030 [Verrucomicrobiota bacterium]